MIRIKNFISKFKKVKSSQNKFDSPNPLESHFPGFDVFGQVPSWDDTTKAIVLSRDIVPKNLRFFTVAEEATCRALLDCLLALEEGPPVAVLEGIDSRLAEEQIDGWYYEEMGPDWDVWKRSLKALEEDSLAHHAIEFHNLDHQKQIELLEDIKNSERWKGFPSGPLWSLWMRYACTELYSYPQVWNEMGFGGPAYPRGYKALGVDRLEPWEVVERKPFNPTQWAQRIESAKARQLPKRGGN